MKLAEMTVNEAIEMAIREVPETKPQVYGLRTLLEAADTTLDPDVSYAIGHCIWFTWAWEWLIRFGDGDEFFRVVGYTTNWAVDKVKYLGGALESTSDVGLDLPTKYHALAAAVLLAAGKDVP